MENVAAPDRDEDTGDLRPFLIGLARGGAGAMLFGIPMLMTMELWQLGFYIDRTRLFLLLVLTIPLLVLLAHRIGFERTTTWHEACRDAVIAYALGIVMSAAILILLGDIEPHMPVSEILGKIAIQAVPASIGALLGRAQLTGDADDGEEDQEDEAEGKDDDRGKPLSGEKSAEKTDAVANTLSTSYGRELFLMGVGALFLNLNVAPTEEIILISYRMTPWHAIACIAVSIAIMHGFVYAVSFKGSHDIPEETPWWHVFFRFTLPGYMVATGISLYVLWTFGRLDDTAPTQMIMSAIVLSFPGAIGAAAARLIL